jgi:hypothetical protein
VFFVNGRREAQSGWFVVNGRRRCCDRGRGGGRNGAGPKGGVRLRTRGWRDAPSWPPLRTPHLCEVDEAALVRLAAADLERLLAGEDEPNPRVAHEQHLCAPARSEAAREHARTRARATRMSRPPAWGAPHTRANEPAGLSAWGAQRRGR